MNRYTILMALLVLLSGTEARAYNIGFGMPNGSLPNPHNEGGFEVRGTGPVWAVQDGVATNNGGSGEYMAIFGEGFPDPKNIGATDYPEFVFKSVDLSSYSASTTFVIQGFDDNEESNTLFRHGVTFNSNTFGRISLNNTTEFFNGCSLGTDCNIKRLTIAMQTTPGILPDGYKYTIDNVCLNGGPCPTYDQPGGGSSVPEPTSLMLLGAGLAGIGIWRRKVRGEAEGV